MQWQKFFTGLLKRNLLYSEYILCSQPFQSNIQRHINHTRYWWIKRPFRHHIVTKLTKCKKEKKKKRKEKSILPFRGSIFTVKVDFLIAWKNVTEMLANTSNVTATDGWIYGECYTSFAFLNSFLLWSKRPFASVKISIVKHYMDLKNIDE